MLAAPHPRQAERLERLRDYGILDTPPEAEFEGIVQAASRVCQAPVALISFVDSDRQWFKAEIGLGAEQTGLDASICSHAILRDAPVFEVADTLEDPLTADNPIVCGPPHFRFYAGAVMRTEDGMPLGSLCVLDYEPRRLDPTQREVLSILAAQVVKQLELRAALRRESLMRAEVDHRVKNSLQSVAALARMQKRLVKSASGRDALDVVVGRIETVSALHEALSRSDRNGRVELSTYLEEIAAFLRLQAPENVAIDVQAEEGLGCSRVASALAVIANEFATNSFKYAYPEGQRGRVQFQWRYEADGRRRFICADDGIGMPADPPRTGLGQRIISATIAQLGAEVQRPATARGHRLEVLLPERVASVVSDSAGDLAAQ